MNDTNDKTNTLRAVVDNEALSIEERKDAAALFVTLTVETVTDPADDNPEVAALRQPWDDKFLAECAAPATNGRSLTGWSLPDAREHVAKRHRQRVVLALIVDEALPRLIRLAACQTMLDSFLHPNGRHRKGAYSPERLLSEVAPADAYKWTTQGKLPVSRPPLTVADVWSM